MAYVLGFVIEVGANRCCVSKTFATVCGDHAVADGQSRLGRTSARVVDLLDGRMTKYKSAYNPGLPCHSQHSKLVQFLHRYVCLE